MKSLIGIVLFGLGLVSGTEAYCIAGGKLESMS